MDLVEANVDLVVSGWLLNTIQTHILFILFILFILSILFFYSRR